MHPALYVHDQSRDFDVRGQPPILEYAFAEDDVQLTKSMQWRRSDPAAPLWCAMFKIGRS